MAWERFHTLSNIPVYREASLPGAVAAAPCCSLGPAQTDAAARRCHFDPHELVCPAGAAADACLSPAQADAVAQIYNGPKDPATGGPVSWGFSNTLAAENRAWFALGAPMSGPLAALIYDDPARTVIDLAQAAREARIKLAPLVNPDPDLSRARALGRKILIYHGWVDPMLTPQRSIAFLEAVQKRVGSTDGFLRLFMVPGMFHCAGLAGMGADFIGEDTNAEAMAPQLTDADHNWDAALERWVEEGRAPDRIIGTEFQMDAAPGPQQVPLSAAVRSTRPICPYPKVAVYKGRGLATEAENFVCRVP